MRPVLWLARGATLGSLLVALYACGGGAGTATPTTATYPGQAGDFTKSVSVAGVTRTYLLHVPASYESASASPVVLLFHGGGGTAATISNVTGGFSALADRSGFIAVYPESVSGNWDDGRETITDHTNDVAFTAALLDAVAIEYRVDARRVYAAGISNGGMMSHRLACELSSRLAAIAAVAANIPSAITATCLPARALPVAMFSGTADPLMPYNGGAVAGGGVGGTVLSAPETASLWAAKNQAGNTPQVTALPDTITGDGTTTDLLGYTSGTGAGEVALYRINGGGHTWPGGTQYYPASFIGPVSQDFSANDAIWAFFVRHPQP
jgi:polyhydroxybutyrate depolymerase